MNLRDFYKLRKRSVGSMQMSKVAFEIYWIFKDYAVLYLLSIYILPSRVAEFTIIDSEMRET